jgi:hypothetical protein
VDDRLKTHFDVLFGTLRDYQVGFFSGAFTATGFLILVIGWLLTSKEARVYLGRSGRARLVGTAVLGLGFVVYAVVSWRVFALSQSVFDGLVGLNYLPLTAYADRRIETTTLFIFVAQNALLTLVACYFMLDTKAERSRTS